MPDVLYYNISIDNTDPYVSGLSKGVNSYPINTDISVQNTEPILENPSEWYGSIIRMEVPTFTVPVIQFITQTPIVNPTDINRGVYTFTLEYNGIFSDQINYTYIPQVIDTVIPPYPTLTQTFGPYYFIYNYGVWIDIMNTALKSAFISLQGKVGGALASCTVPFFNYDGRTQLISLYTDAAFFENNVATPVFIYFNSISSQNFNGFQWNEDSIGSANGADCVFTIKNRNGLNQQTLNSVVYNVLTQEFVALGYLSQLKRIVVTTSMNIVSEIDYINNPSAVQNINYQNVLTDYLPDLSGPNEAGIVSKIFIYNAPSLYRVFELKDRTPLYNVSLRVQWTDQLGNTFPLQLAKGLNASFKIMFIKKTAFPKFLL
jgi:hypothetical protein